MSVQQRICSVPVDAYVDGPPGQSTKKFGYDTELRVRGSAANTFQRAFIQFDAAACVPSAAIVKQPAPRRRQLSDGNRYQHHDHSRI